MSAASRATVDKIDDGVLVQGFRELVDKLALLEAYDKSISNGVRVQRDVLADEVMACLRDGYADGGERPALLNDAFAEISVGLLGCGHNGADEGCLRSIIQGA